MEIQSVNTVPTNFHYNGSKTDYLSEKFYGATTGKVGTDTAKVFNILYDVYDNNLKDDFETSVKKTYIRHNKVPFNTVQDILKDELTGANEKWAVAVYDHGDKNKAKVNFLDHVKSSFENLGDYFTNQPYKAVGELALITAVSFTKLPFWGKLLGAIGIITASDLVSNSLKKKEESPDQMKFKA